MKDCIFCQIANKVIPAEFIHESDSYFAIKDINPKSKTHILIIPKQHFSDSNTLPSSFGNELFEFIAKLGTKLNQNHYKIQINTGSESGQEVFHFHAHFISSSALKSTTASE